MRVRVLLQITGDDGTAGGAMEVAVFEKRTERPEDLGLSITDGKVLMAEVQQRVVNAQVTSWAERHRCCEACGARRRSKGSHPVVFLTLYGDVQIASPRLHRCPCQDSNGPMTVSPLRTLIPDHVAPERLYLEARWASLVPYAAAAELLTDVLPVSSGANATTLRDHVLRVAEHAEAELAEERPCFIEGCPADWAGLPIPEGRIVVGLDGGYLRDWQDRKTNFEVIVGQSVPEDRDARYVGLVHGYDRKPKRRLFDVLKSQGLQPNQDVTFLTDGGEEIRALTELVTPESEHVLDWFHITMCLSSTPAVSPIMTQPLVSACWSHSRVSNGCSGMATNIAPDTKSGSSRMTSAGWNWTTHISASSSAQRMNLPSTSPAIPRA
jgi:hypothetical protein